MTVFNVLGKRQKRLCWNKQPLPFVDTDASNRNHGPIFISKVKSAVVPLGGTSSRFFPFQLMSNLLVKVAWLSPWLLAWKWRISVRRASINTLVTRNAIRNSWSLYNLQFEALKVSWFEIVSIFAQRFLTRLGLATKSNKYWWIFWWEAYREKYYTGNLRVSISVRVYDLLSRHNQSMPKKESDCSFQQTFVDKEHVIKPLELPRGRLDCIACWEMTRSVVSVRTTTSFNMSTADPTSHRNFALIVIFSGRKFQNEPESSVVES